MRARVVLRYTREGRQDRFAARLNECGMPDVGNAFESAFGVTAGVKSTAIPGARKARASRSCPAASMVTVKVPAPSAAGRGTVAVVSSIATGRARSLLFKGFIEVVPGRFWDQFRII
jgi:hypothetical protein